MLNSIRCIERFNDYFRLHTGQVTYRSGIKSFLSTHCYYILLIISFAWTDSMSNISRPSADAFQKAGWIAVSEKVLLEYLEKLASRARSRRGGDETLLSSVQAFKEFIEHDPVVFTDFIRMFENAVEPPKDYMELVYMLDGVFRESPTYGAVCPPLNTILTKSMNTQGGFSAYTKENFNRHLKNMLKTWVLYLGSPDSRSVLNDAENGWFSAAALDALMEQYNGRTFEEVFICDPYAPYHGFISFDDFFTRRYRSPEVDRPVEKVDDSSLVSAATESIIYAYQKDVKLIDELFIKDERYSLLHLLAGDAYTDQFVGGSVLQGFLSVTGYHRWHSPVTGHIRRITTVPGTYFAEAPVMLDSPIPPPGSDELPPYLKSFRYFANTNTRQLIFIEADNDDIGLVCFIAIGMGEVSTCQATVYEGEHVMRGDHLGMFHFGGSASALVFRAAANLQIDPQLTVPGAFIKINQTIASVPTPLKDGDGEIKGNIGLANTENQSWTS